MKIQNPHDKFFKETFSNVEVARDFMKNYRPKLILKIIDLQTFEIQKDSFIDEELKEVFSDMLFEAKIKKKRCKPNSRHYSTGYLPWERILEDQRVFG